jgi:CheY-like chemotaxis protein
MQIFPFSLLPVAILNTYLLPFFVVLVVVIVIGLLRRQSQEAEADPREAAVRSVAEPAPEPALPAVLVVDDSAVVRAKLRKLFEGVGWRVALARDGNEALEVLASARVSVLVTDLEMPGMDGFELIAAVQGALETENLPIIAITGHEELHARVHALQGLYGLFSKPWNDRELLRRAEALARLHAPAGTVAADASTRAGAP